jgi:hypothetical protein
MFKRRGSRVDNLVKDEFFVHRAARRVCARHAALLTDQNQQVSQRTTHSGLLDPRGTSTVLKEPGVLDRTT